MDFTLILGIFAATILVMGAAWKPTPLKNKLFTAGNVGMFIYALLNYQNGGSVFFVLLESLILISTVLMLLEVSDKKSTLILTASGLSFVIWSLFLFEDYTTVIFIFGLTVLGMGFAFKNDTLRRDVALTAGSAVLGLFSYLDQAWLFVYINLFFLVFSGYYLLKRLKKSPKSS